MGWVTNFTSDPVELDIPSESEVLIGGSTIDGFGVSVIEAPLSDVHL